MSTLMAETLEEAFRQFDLDGNGTLEESELKAAYEAAGRPVGTHPNLYAGALVPIIPFR